MSPNQPNLRKLGFYYSLAQVGLEMAIPPGVGLWIDHSFQTFPWAVIIGAILGLCCGMLHLVALLIRNSQTKKKSSQPKQDSP